MGARMSLPISLRTKQTEQRYQDDKLANNTSDIAKVPPKEIKGLSKIVKNRYEYDLVYKQSDLAIAMPGTPFWLWFENLGKLLRAGEFDEYDQLVINIGKRQSQPHIPHAHLVVFDEEKIKKLREYEWTK